MGFELIIVLALILVNGFFAMAEMAIVSSRRAKLKALAVRDAGARKAVALAEQPARFLSTVQVGITAIGALTAAYGGATIAESAGAVLDTVPGLAGYGEAISFAGVVLAITVLSVILGELVPKRIALANPERIAAAVARPMGVISRIFAPAVTVLSGASSLVIGMFGLKAQSTDEVTEEEIRHLVGEGAASGAILAQERDMVMRIFRLSDKLVADIMTPRPQMVWLDADASVEENLERMRQSKFSRYPVQRSSTDAVLGILRAKDLVAVIGGAPAGTLFANLRPPLFVPDTTPALSMMEQFRQANLHMALVVDEYGDVKGLVTPTDILEAIIGEIGDTQGAQSSSIVERADGSLLVDAGLAADELKERLALSQLPREEDDDYATVAGLMLSRFERIPHEGDAFDWQGYRFEVVDMDGRRIDKVLVTRLAAVEAVPPP